MQVLVANSAQIRLSCAYRSSFCMFFIVRGSHNAILKRLFRTRQSLARYPAICYTIMPDTVHSSHAPG